MERVSYGRRLAQLAQEHPHRTAIHHVSRDGTQQELSWAEFDARSNRLARRLNSLCIGQGSLVVVGLPNCPEHLIADFAAWKLGATVLSLRAALPGPERDAILATAEPALVISEWEGITQPELGRADVRASQEYPDAPLPFDRVASPAIAVASGGSTGRPKVIVMPGSTAMAVGTMPARLAPMGFAAGDIQLVAAPLYHSMPFNYAVYGLFEDHTLVVMEAFDAELAVDLIRLHQVSFAYLAPTMMRRIALLQA
jgi:bile acid-coenzyme A ligase